jgi:hypothetical protein
MRKLDYVSRHVASSAFSNKSNLVFTGKIRSVFDNLLFGHAAASSEKAQSTLSFPLHPSILRYPPPLLAPWPTHVPGPIPHWSSQGSAWLAFFLYLKLISRWRLTRRPEEGGSKYCRNVVGKLTPDSHLHTHRRENLKSYEIQSIFFTFQSTQMFNTDQLSATVNTAQSGT